MQKLGARGALAATVVGVLVVVALGWFAFLSPQRSKVSDLEAQNTAAEAQLQTAQHVLATTSTAKSEVVLREAKRALPDDTQMSQILRQLSADVKESQTELESLTPGPAAAGVTGGEVVPLAATVRGDYFALQHLLRLLRQSADVAGKRITGHGRLYSVDSIQFASAISSSGSSSSAGAAAGAGNVTATISLNAFIFATPPPTPGVTAASATDTTTSSGGSSSASAAGTTP